MYALQCVSSDNMSQRSLHTFLGSLRVSAQSSWPLQAGWSEWEACLCCGLEPGRDVGLAANKSSMPFTTKSLIVCGKNQEPIAG